MGFLYSLFRGKGTGRMNAFEILGGGEPRTEQQLRSDADQFF